MENHPQRKLILVLMTLAVVAFLSVSIIPLISGLINPPQAPESSASSPQSPKSNEAQRLQDEEKGYQTVLSREPNNETALKGLFQTRAELIQLGLRTPKDLIDPLEKLKNQNPEQTDFAILLAQAHQQAGDREASARTYREILQGQPGNINALQGLVSLFIQENQPEAAVSLLQKTLQAEPGNAGQPIDKEAIQLLLGDVYTAQQNYDQALALYESLAAQDPQDFRPVVGKAIALRAQGKTSEAKLSFDKAVALAPAQFKDRIKQLATEAPNPVQSPAVP